MWSDRNEPPGARLTGPAAAHKYAFMRTTIDLPDPLFREAKAVAALQGVTLKVVIEESLRRLLQPHAQRRPAASGGRLRAKNGFLVLKTKGKQVIDPTRAQLDDFL